MVALAWPCPLAHARMKECRYIRAIPSMSFRPKTVVGPLLTSSAVGVPFGR